MGHNVQKLAWPAQGPESSCCLLYTSVNTAHGDLGVSWQFHHVVN